MTESTHGPDAASSSARSAAPHEDKPAKKGGLSTMLLPELRQLAGSLGIKTSGMKKADLVAAIRTAQAGGGTRRQTPRDDGQAATDAASEKAQRDAGTATESNRGRTGGPEGTESAEQKAPNRNRGGGAKADQQAKGQQGAGKQVAQQQQPDQQPADSQAAAQPGGQQPSEEGGTRRNRRRRGRDRSTTPTTGQQSGGRTGREPDLNILEDDVLTPCSGVLDLLENYAFLRTSGYLAGAEDVYVSLSMVRRYGLRRGDAITGQVRAPRDGERREKFNPLVRIDAVNGADPDIAPTRAQFTDLTAVHPTEQLRLETERGELTGRLADLVAPLGKGQRALLVAPHRTGRTTILHAVARAISTNHPEAHLMVLLLNERPEEITDFQRSVQGEVISSAFDRAAADHIMAAELALERAKRLVELGHDVVLLADGLSRLGRAYNAAAPAGGRVTDGVDAGALQAVKRFLGAARKIEDAGSLTLLATVALDGATPMDQVVLSEVMDVANLELWLRPDLADRKVFPTIDLARSHTRHEDQMLTDDERRILGAVREALVAMDPYDASVALRGLLAQYATNMELLLAASRTTPADLLRRA